MIHHPGLRISPPLHPSASGLDSYGSSTAILPAPSPLLIPALFVALFCSLLALPATASPPPSISAASGPFWELDTKEGCAGSVSFSCGPARHFSFYTSQPPSRSPTCVTSMVAGGSYAPATYANDNIPAPSSLPCNAGSCFASGTDRFLPPDVLVIDWDDPHGWSVGGVIDSMAAGSALLALDAFEDGTSALDSVLGSGVTDAHVLEKLCAVVETSIESRPKVINMSFGRPAPANLAATCSGSGDLPFLCYVDEVLDELVQDGSYLVAAAGHHGRELFPAAGTGTWSAGSVDLLALETKALSPAEHTPADADLLMPGYGVFVGSAFGHPSLWSAPPGSSYSAAVASGWIIHGLLNDPAGASAFLDLSATTDFTLGPIELPDGEWALGFAPSLYMPGSISERSKILMETALGHRPGDCTHHSALSSRLLTLNSSFVSLPADTLDDIREDLNVPCPESFPCVPCHDLPDEPPLHTGDPLATKSLDSEHADFEQEAAIAIIRIIQRLDIDLSQSVGIELDKYDLLGIYFRMNGQNQRFVESTDTGLLRALETGDVDKLTITNPPADAWDRSTYLVFHMRRKATHATAGREFTVSIPITVHGH